MGFFQRPVWVSQEGQSRAGPGRQVAGTRDPHPGRPSSRGPGLQLPACPARSAYPPPALGSREDAEGAARNEDGGRGGSAAGGGGRPRRGRLEQVGAAQRGGHRVPDHPADAVPGAEVLPQPPVPGGRAAVGPGEASVGGGAGWGAEGAGTGKGPRWDPVGSGGAGGGKNWLEAGGGSGWE